MSYACSQVPGSNHTHHCLGQFWLACRCGTFHSKCCSTGRPFSNRHCTWYHPNKDRIYLGPLHSPRKEVGKLLKYYIIIVFRHGSVLKQEIVKLVIISSEIMKYSYRHLRPQGIRERYTAEMWSPNQHGFHLPYNYLRLH